MVSLFEVVVVVKIGGEKKFLVSEFMDEGGLDCGLVNVLFKVLGKDFGFY